MKNLFTVLLLLLVTFTVFSQDEKEPLPNYSWFENDVRFNNIDGEDPIVTLTHFGFFPITEKFGFTDYASIEGNNNYDYGQLLIGGYYNITNEISVYLLAGKESISKDLRLGYMAYFTNGDQFRVYAFYQRNQNPFAEDTKDSEWYDIMFRWGAWSEENFSIYLGARYMKWYGLGKTLTFRQKIGDGDSVYLGYTTYFDVNNEIGPPSDNVWGDITPTLSLTFEFF